MTQLPLWDRLRRARVVQIVLVYLGASWIVLQIIETLMGLLTLPSWVGPVALVLLLVGLFVVLATAWVQSLPRTTAREEAGEVPTDWQVAPGDIVASVRAGRLPHLTWGRALLGGVFALSLLFGAAGVYVVLRGPSSPLGPAEVGAEGTSSGIAVLPFHVTGPSLDLYREGMVDLMSSNLDGLSGYRAVDSRTVLARWNRDVGEGGEAELDDALKVAAGTGARFAVLGSGVELGSRIRFTADLYDLDTGEKVGSGQAEGDPDDVLSLVDALTVEVMRSLLDATGQGSAGQDLRLASLLTKSVPALRDYLQGDALFRRGQFEEAREALERAVQEDSTFALAHWRLGEAIGWISGIGNPEGGAHKRLAARYGDRLPPREATLLAVSSATSQGRALDELGTLEAYLARYPDDPDGWYDLGEMGLHAPTATGISDDRLQEALYKAVELDPTFGPYYVHALEWASAKGQRERFDSLMAGWARAGEDEAGLERFRIRAALLLGDDTERAAAVDSLKTKDDQFVNRVDQFLLGELDHDLDRALLTREELARRKPSARLSALDVFEEQGRFREAREIAERDSTWGGRSAVARLVSARWSIGAADTTEVRSALASLGGSPPPDVALDVAFSRAFLAAILGDRPAYDAGVAQIESLIGGPLAGMAAVRDTAQVRRAVESALQARWMAMRGRETEAYELLNGASGVDFFADMVGELALEVGRWSEAVKVNEGISRSTPGRSAAKFRLGRAYEELGDRERALDAYRTFLSRYEKADPGLPWVEEARSAVARLGG
jgi:tetratricopeptide (TPR) repeat protein